MGDLFWYLFQTAFAQAPSTASKPAPESSTGGAIREIFSSPLILIGLVLLIGLVILLVYMKKKQADDD